MPTAQQQQSFHPLPVIGYPETYYAKHIQQADKAGDAHAHAAFKVGQYVTLALDHKINWDEKLRFVKHTLKHHCATPADGDDQMKEFYRRLCELVKRHAGQEALRLARAENDSYSLRVDTGTPREEIESEAEVFFTNLMGHTDTCPEWFTKETWAQLKMIRDKWI
jgi:hypothetical protein